MRRLIRLTLTAARLLASCAALALVLTWIASRILTDRIAWSQYAWWVPTLAYAAVSILTLTAWTILARLQRHHPTRRAPSISPSEISNLKSEISPSPSSEISNLKSQISPPSSPETPNPKPENFPAHRPLPAGRITRAVLASIILLILTRAAIFEYRLYRYLTPRTSDPNAIRIANWNPALPTDTLRGPLESLDADVIAIVNQSGHRMVNELAASLGEGWTAIRADRLSVLTRFPIKRWGETRLGLDGRVMRAYDLRELDVRLAERVDEGRAIFIELLTPDPLVLWVVDLPSDFRLARHRIMADAARAIAAFEGRIYTYDDDGNRLVERIETGFPDADVIVGDFNTPRASHSLRTLVGDRVNAYDAAGRGYAATFPRDTPIAQIDLMFVSRDWRTLSYHVVDPGDGWHRAQVGEIVKRR
jgi:hypothetical protein